MTFECKACQVDKRHLISSPSGVHNLWTSLHTAPFHLFQCQKTLSGWRSEAPVLQETGLTTRVGQHASHEFLCPPPVSVLSVLLCRVWLPTVPPNIVQTPRHTGQQIGTASTFQSKEMSNDDGLCSASPGH
ncbi:hypothetical protein BaRGS_00039070 [Batillaria attramentaria]|uniref:Uncharacterized protein n=1 Tax=Batillaria attramentaria TaxID=370345 RepID=A0ABD0J4C7_9CAEN